MPRNTIRIALPAALLLLAIAGCSSTATPSTPSPKTVPNSQSAPSSTAAPSSAPDAAAAQIVIDNFAFSPMNLTVHPGQGVTVVNHDSTTHTLTSSGGKFDAGPVTPGKSATFTAPTTAGTYPYVCTIHASMRGTLTVR
jgi:plastocyanin